MQREEVFEYVKNKYHTKPEYLWKKFPNYAVLRHQENQKWYAIIMDVDQNKTGLSGSDVEDLMDIKLKPETVASLQEFSEFLPAYHMNKTHWLSVRLKKIKPEELAKIISESFELTK